MLTSSSPKKNALQATTDFFRFPVVNALLYPIPSILLNDAFELLIQMQSLAQCNNWERYVAKKTTIKQIAKIENKQNTLQ